MKTTMFEILHRPSTDAGNIQKQKIVAEIYDDENICKARAECST